LKISPFFVPIGIFGMLLDTYIYIDFASRGHYDTANGFLMLDLITLPFTAFFSVGLAYRLSKTYRIRN